MFHLSQAIFSIFFYQIDCPIGQVGLVGKEEYVHEFLQCGAFQEPKVSRRIGVD